MLRIIVYTLLLPHQVARCGLPPSKGIDMTTYTVLLDTLDGDTVATIKSDTINDLPIEEFMGEIMDGWSKDENGCPIRVEGRLVEVLEVA